METVMRAVIINGETFINRDDLTEYLKDQIGIAETLNAKSIVKGIISDLKNGEKNG